MTGEGDVDLLVAAADLPRFAAVAHGLGCRLARPAPAAEVAGVTSWYGYDPALSNFVLLHVHTRLVIGEYWRTLCRVPIEAAVLADLVPRTLLSGTLESALVGCHGPCFTLFLILSHHSIRSLTVFS